MLLAATAAVAVAARHADAGAPASLAAVVPVRKACARAMWAAACGSNAVHFAGSVHVAVHGTVAFVGVRAMRARLHVRATAVNAGPAQRRARVFCS